MPETNDQPEEPSRSPPQSICRENFEEKVRWRDIRYDNLPILSSEASENMLQDVWVFGPFPCWFRGQDNRIGGHPSSVKPQHAFLCPIGNPYRTHDIVPYVLR